jgi:hypothetical protein
MEKSDLRVNSFGVKIFGILIVCLVTVMFLSPLHKVGALNGSDFNAGHIIDDEVFENSSALSVSSIQSFLDQQMPSCDTSGSQSISYYYNSVTGEVNNSTTGTWITTTRAVYGQRYATWWNAQPTNSQPSNYMANESLAPYVCLNSFIENPTNGQTNLQNPSASVAGGESAAQIIYNAAQQYQINPEVILTTLQKEQGLITDNWPWTNEYSEAMGYNCPDTPQGCTGFAGFVDQVQSAAAQYRNYMNNPNNFDYIVGNNTVDFAPPSDGCTGSSVVDIQNQATAALYDYTPYQPDSNVLAKTNPTGSSSGPGASVSGDSCAAYGNRNFWWYFNTWFGSSYFNLNTTYDVGDDSVDSSGDIAIIPIRLSAQPLSTIQLNYEVSNTSIAEIFGNYSLIFTTSDWNDDQYIVVKGLSSTADSQDFSLVVAYINSPAGSYSQSVTPYLNSLPIFWQNLNDQTVDRLYDSSTGKHAYAVTSGAVTSLESSGYTLESTLGFQCSGSTNTPLVVNNTLGIVANLDSPDITNKETATPMILYSNTNGSILVTILDNPKGTDTVLSVSTSEVSSLEQSGYTNVTSFLLCNSGNIPVYRLYDPVNGSHFYTASSAEVSSSLTIGLSYEGVGFYVNSAGTVPVYRLYDPVNETHFYTASSSELTSVENMGYQYEGIAFYAGNSTGPVYRLYDPVNGSHFYTASSAEVTEVEALGYRYECIAFYTN